MIRLVHEWDRRNAVQRCFSNRTRKGCYKATASCFVLCFIVSSGCSKGSAEWWLQSLNELYSYRLAICHCVVSVEAELWATLHPGYMVLLYTLPLSFISIIPAYASWIMRCDTNRVSTYHHGQHFYFLLMLHCFFFLYILKLISLSLRFFYVYYTRKGKVLKHFLNTWFF